VLRALTLLRNGIREPSPSTEVDLRPYARKVEPQPHFDLTVFFEFELADAPPFDPSQGFKWDDFVAQQKPVAALHLRFWGTAILAFRGAQMLLPSGSFPLIEVTTGGMPPFPISHHAFRATRRPAQRRTFVQDSPQAAKRNSLMDFQPILG